MSKEMVIGSNRHETKVAILEEDQLVEVYFQRANEYSLAGSIHKGRVTRVLPGMQSAFVDLGLERDTFLYVSDFFEEHDDIDTVSEEKPPAPRQERERRPPPAMIEDRQPEPRDFAMQSAPAGAGEPVDPTLSPLPSGNTRTPTDRNANDRNAGDRSPNDRNADDRNRNDRRGRRSRRRRPGGRDFPDNKYASPSSTSPTSQPPAEIESRSVAEPVFAPLAETEPDDVMVLPGESLAKYRNKPAPAPVRMDEPVEEDFVEEDDSAPEPEIVAEAESLGLTEAVFSHQPLTELDEDPIEQVEAKLEQVEQDQPAEEAPAAADEPPSLVVVVAEVTEEAAPLEEESEPEEFDLANAEEALPDFEDLAPEIEEALAKAAGENSSRSTLVGDITTENESEAEEDESAESEEAVSAEGAGSERPVAQTAEVRDQSGRSMHRVSRRSRRRRGGNRFGGSQQGGSQQSGSQQEGGPKESASPAPPPIEVEPKREPQPETRLDVRGDRPPMPSISELLKPGQEIIVQIAKEPLGQKGARITSHIALPGRYVVFMPSVNHLGVSRKVSSEEERQRLKRILQAHRAGTAGGFIIRTAGEGVPEEEIAADMNFLYSLWLDIRQKAEKKPAPALLHYDLDIVQRILRDQVTDEFKAIWVDNEELYENVVTFMQRHQPSLVNRVKMYTRAAPIFDAFNITQELEKALRPKVWLKSGGYIVINQTEALVAIDINTGKFVGKSNRLEDTIVKTNLEAVKEIVRQIRLRDLGGIIVVDFIDMDERKNRQKVMQALEEAMREDKAPNKILQFNDFGLVAITRKRVKQSLERTLCAPCHYCEGAGYVKSVQTTIGEILVEAQKLAKAIEGKDVMLRVHPEVAKVLKARDNRYLEELEEILARPVLVKSDPALHSEKFDLV